MPLESGDKAPDFTLLDQHGETFSLGASLKQRKVKHLIYFYPRADTPGCTTQACGLRDAQKADELGETVVVGISPDKPQALEKFDTKYELGFPLLSDVDHSVAEGYGAWGEKKNYGKTYQGVIRSAFLVDEDGRIEQAWPKISPKDTPTKLKAALAGA